MGMDWGFEMLGIGEYDTTPLLFFFFFPLSFGPLGPCHDSYDCEALLAYQLVLGILSISHTSHPPACNESLLVRCDVLWNHKPLLCSGALVVWLAVVAGGIFQRGATTPAPGSLSIARDILQLGLLVSSAQRREI